ncbi:hypothetical protein HanIR_Chr14g0686221 [Helianthus annuus]|nr:hypothetical protein HanIR_Chr14g0686221 [Helianthus annuus]
MGNLKERCFRKLDGFKCFMMADECMLSPTGTPGFIDFSTTLPQKHLKHFMSTFFNRFIQSKA